MAELKWLYRSNSFSYNCDIDLVVYQEYSKQILRWILLNVLGLRREQTKVFPLFLLNKALSIVRILSKWFPCCSDANVSITKLLLCLPFMVELTLVSV